MAAHRPHIKGRRKDERMFRFNAGKILIKIPPFWRTVRERRFDDRDVTEYTLEHWPSGEIKIEYRDGLNRQKDR